MALLHLHARRRGTQDWKKKRREGDSGIGTSGGTVPKQIRLVGPIEASNVDDCGAKRSSRADPAFDLAFHAKAAAQSGQHIAEIIL